MLPDALNSSAILTIKKDDICYCLTKWSQNRGEFATEGFLTELLQPRLCLMLLVVKSVHSEAECSSSSSHRSEDGDLEFHLTNNNIKAVIWDIFSAGSETSSTTIEWAMSEMLKNPRLMKEAQAEVRRVFDGKGKVDEFGIHELKFLKAVIKETLRKSGGSVDSFIKKDHRSYADILKGNQDQDHLEDTLSELQSSPELSKRSHTFSNIAFQDGSVRVGSDDVSQTCHNRKHSHPIVLKKVGSMELREKEKGKGPRVRIQRPKELPLFYQNAKIIIGKSKCQEAKKVAVVSTSFSSSSDSMGPVRFKGECSSKNREDGLLKSGFSESGLGDSMMGSSSDSGMDGSNSPINKDPKKVNVLQREISGLIVDLTGEQASEGGLGQALMMRDQQAAEIQPILNCPGNQTLPDESEQVPSLNAIIDQEVVDADINPKTPKKRKGGRNFSTTKCHSMQTRNSKPSETRRQLVV
ncbi:hypothetical protein Q3G72_024101 [Acer saccharum]|nr:hypothetical protein Q3G72_024101 [Acer saccharum]